MRKGIFYSPGNDLKVVQKFMDAFDLQVVGSLPALKKQLDKNEYEFLYAHYEDLDSFQKVFFTAFACRPELPHVIYAKDGMNAGLPRMDQVYVIAERDDPRVVLSILSFHRAKRQGELQTVYDGVDRDHFVLAELSTRGIVFADADDHIFYVNEPARQLLSYQEDLHLVSQYLDFKERVIRRFDDDQRDPRLAVTSYDAVVILTNGSVMSVIKRDVMAGNLKLGTIYFIEDSEEKRLNVKRLHEERRRFEHLATRLNDVLLKDMTSHVYQVSYLKRKLDLEISRSKRSDCQVNVLYLCVRNVADGDLPLTLDKAVLAEINGLLLREFPEPHVMGIVQDGHWLIILQKDGGELPHDVRAITDAVNRLIRSLSPGAGVEARLAEESGLGSYGSSEDLIASLCSMALATPSGTGL